MHAFKFKLLLQYENISHGISTKDFGSMKKDDNSINKKNLTNFLSFMGMSKNGICMGQIHRGDVGVVSNNENLLIENTDGLVTTISNAPLCVLTADCLPILLYDPIKTAIGVAHAGRKGLLNGIVKNTIEKFKKNFQSDPKNIIVGVGPGIEQKCYEVEGEQVDIRKIANDQLAAEGINSENIENIDICTKCDENKFYSFRLGDVNERFVSVISMV